MGIYMAYRLFRFVFISLALFGSSYVANAQNLPKTIFKDCEVMFNGGLTALGSRDVNARANYEYAGYLGDQKFQFLEVEGEPPRFDCKMEWFYKFESELSDFAGRITEVTLINNAVFPSMTSALLRGMTPECAKMGYEVQPLTMITFEPVGNYAITLGYSATCTKYPWGNFFDR